MPNILTESEIEQFALDILKDLDYKIFHGPDIAWDGKSPERSKEQNYKDVVLLERLREAINRIEANMSSVQCLFSI